MHDQEIAVSGEPYIKKSKLLRLAQEYLFAPLGKFFKSESAELQTKTVYADVIIRNQNGQILLLEKTYQDERMEGLWGFPGGHVEADEEPKAAALRETLEETGLVLSDVHLIEQKTMAECVIYYYEAILIQAINSTSTVNPVSESTIILDANEHRGYEWVDASSVKNYALIKDLGSYVDDLISKLFPMTIIQRKYSNPEEAIEKEGDHDLDTYWEILQKAFDEGTITEEQFLKARDQYMTLKMDEAMSTITKAFDEGQITEDQYLQALERSRLVKR